METCIRAAREEDAAGIVALLNPIIDAGTFTTMDEQIAPETQVHFIRNFPARGVLNVAESPRDGRILGIQDVQPLSPLSAALFHLGEISTFVALDCRRSGIGSALMQATLAQASHIS